MNGRCSKDIVTYNHRKYFCINILFVKGVCMFDGIAKHEVVEREVVEHDCFFFFFVFFFFVFCLFVPFQGGTSVVVPYCSCCLCLYFGSSIMLVTYFVNFR